MLVNERRGIFIYVVARPNVTISQQVISLKGEAIF